MGAEKAGCAGHLSFPIGLLWTGRCEPLLACRGDTTRSLRAERSGRAHPRSASWPGALQGPCRPLPMRQLYSAGVPLDASATEPPALPPRDAWERRRRGVSARGRAICRVVGSRGRPLPSPALPPSRSLSLGSRPTCMRAGVKGVKKTCVRIKPAPGEGGHYCCIRRGWTINGVLPVKL